MRAPYFGLRRLELVLGAVLTVVPNSLPGQARFGDENRTFKGFTKSPTEHVMNEFEGVPELRSVRGRVMEASSGVGIPHAKFELRTENPDDVVRGVGTDRDGHFRMGSLPEGIYVFKVTRDGFQSVFGRLRVAKRAPPRNILKVELKHGV